MDHLKRLFPDEGELIDATYNIITAQHEKKKNARPASFDQAASTAMSAEAIAAQAVGNMLLTANSNSMHAEGQAANAIEEMARSEVVALCNPEEQGYEKCVFVDGGAAANEFVMHAVLPVRPKSLGGGLQRDVLLIGEIEHPSLLDKAAAMEHKGFTTEIIPVDRNTGVYNLTILKEKLSTFGERVAFVSTHHANNEIGVIQPLQKIGVLIQELAPQALFHVDCIQTLGKIPLEMAKWKASLVSLSFHKVSGPKRCGAVVATRRGLLPDTYKATKDVAAYIAGLVATKLSIEKMKHNEQTCLAIRKQVTSGIATICEELNVTYKELSQPPPLGAPGILTYLFPGMQGRHFVSMLSDLGLSISSGAACSSQNDKPSKVISSLRVNGEDYFSAVRFSFSSDITDADTAKLLDAMRTTLSKFQPNQARELNKRSFKDDKNKTKDSTAPNMEKKSKKPNRWDRMKKKPKEKKEQVPIEPIVFESDEEIAEIFKSCKQSSYGFDAVMITLGELVLKGSNRKTFEKQMMSNIRKKMASDEVAKELSLWVPKGHPQAGYVLLFHIAPENIPKGGLSQSTSVATIPPPSRQITSTEFEDRIKPLLKEVSGINTVAAVKISKPDWKAIRKSAFETFHCAYEQIQKLDPTATNITFGVTSRRADKRFPMESNDINRNLGANVAAELSPPLKVNLVKPQILIEVIKRGCRVGFIHFDGYPYVGKEVVLKIRKLQEVLNRHQGEGGPLFVVRFSKIQELIAETPDVPASYRTVLYRVFMFRLAKVVAEANYYKALCTGDNIGQVASQTLCNMSVLDKYSDMFVARPLVTFAKEEIIKLCYDLNIFDITKMYGTADCCTVFKPANPVLHVKETDVERILGKLYAAGMQTALDEAVANLTTYHSSDLVGTLPDKVTPPASCPYEPKQKIPKIAPKEDSTAEKMDVEN